MADVSLSSLKRAPRRETYVLTASNAALAIPVWAQGGNGIAILTMCGGGNGGGNRVAATVSGGSGSPTVVRLQAPIPSGVSTLNCQIGAGGAGAAASSDTNGAAGGETSVTIGSTTYRVSTASGFVPGTVATGTNLSGSQGNAVAASEWSCVVASGGVGTSSSIGGNQGAGGRSLLGVGGSGWASTPTNTAGTPASGYGAGGAIGYGTGAGGNGAQGVAFIEFVEGV